MLQLKLTINEEEAYSLRLVYATFSTFSLQTTTSASQSVGRRVTFAAVAFSVGVGWKLGELWTVKKVVK